MLKCNHFLQFGESNCSRSDLKILNFDWHCVFIIRGVTTSTHLFISKTNNIMLRWSITFLVIAIIAGILGFAGLAGTAAYFAKILFVVAIIVFIISLLTGRNRANL